MLNTCSACCIQLLRENCSVRKGRLNTLRLLPGALLPELSQKARKAVGEDD